MTVVLKTAPGGAATRTLTIRKNGVATALTVTLTGAETTKTDAVNTVTYNQFDLLSLLQTQSVGPSPAASSGISSIQFI